MSSYTREQEQTVLARLRRQEQITREMRRYGGSDNDDPIRSGVLASVIAERDRAVACIEKVRRADGFETKRGGTWIGVVWRSVLDAILAEYDKEAEK